MSYELTQAQADLNELSRQRMDLITEMLKELHNQNSLAIEMFKKLNKRLDEHQTALKVSAGTTEELLDRIAVLEERPWVDLYQ